MTTTAAREVRIRQPVDFDGDRTQTKKFLQSVELYFQVNPDIYDTDIKKVALALSFMTEGMAGAWREAKISKYTATSPPMYPTWAAFKMAVETVFNPINAQAEALAKLKALKQDGPVEDYIAKFWVIAPATEITEDRALLEYFYDGLDPNLLERVYTCDNAPTTLANWYTTAAMVDNQI